MDWIILTMYFIITVVTIAAIIGITTKRLVDDIACNKVLLKSALKAIQNLEWAVKDLQEEIIDLKNNQK